MNHRAFYAVSERGSECEWSGANCMNHQHKRYWPLFYREWMKINLEIELNRCSIKVSIVPFFSGEERLFINWTDSHKSINWFRPCLEMFSFHSFLKIWNCLRCKFFVFISKCRNCLNCMLRAILCIKWKIPIPGNDRVACAPELRITQVYVISTKGVAIIYLSISHT